MRVVCISDTHLMHGFDVPEGDLLLHAGDSTSRGSLDEVRWFSAWLARLPHPHKVVIAGNHDYAFQKTPKQARRLLPPGVIYLQDSGTEIGGLRIWGSPWQPWACDMAFNLPRGKALRAMWKKIPANTDVLLTHGPPAGILDIERNGDHVGCEELTARLKQLNVRLHVFGHIHEAYGKRRKGGTRYVNASVCTRSYCALNPPIVVDL